MLSARSLRSLALLVAIGATAQAQDDPALVARGAERSMPRRSRSTRTSTSRPAQMTGPSPNYATGIPRNQVDLPKMETGRPRCRLLQRLRGAAAGLQRHRLRPGEGGRPGEVRGDARPGRQAGAGAHRPRPHRGGRPPDPQVGQEGGADGRREWLRHRHRHHQRQAVLRPRGPVPVARPQRAQPALRLEHGRARRRLEVERAEPRSAGRSSRRPTGTAS